MSAKLSAKQHLALECLLSEGDITRAAIKAGVSTRSLFRWLNDAAFASEYQRLRRQAVDAAVSRLQKASVTAVDTLETLVSDPLCPHAARIAASRIILELSLKGVELTDVMTRVEALERMLTTIPQGTGNGKANGYGLNHPA